MRKATEVFLLAENRLLREALIRLLSKKSEVRVIGASGYSSVVREEIIGLYPQIILLDSRGLTFAGATLISTLRTAIRNLRVVMVDMGSEENTFLYAVRAGVVGYVLKDASALEVASAIAAVAAGEAVCPSALSMALFRFVEQRASVVPAIHWREDVGLSRREQQMVELLSERLTNKEIAGRLNLSEQTVKNHVHRILRKVGASTRSSIVDRCISSAPVSPLSLMAGNQPTTNAACLEDVNEPSSAPLKLAL